MAEDSKGFTEVKNQLIEEITKNVLDIANLMKKLNINIEKMIERGEFVDSFYDLWISLRNQTVDTSQLLHILPTEE